MHHRLAEYGPSFCFSWALLQLAMRVSVKIKSSWVSLVRVTTTRIKCTADQKVTITTYRGISTLRSCIVTIRLLVLSQGFPMPARSTITRLSGSASVVLTWSFDLLLQLTFVTFTQCWAFGVSLLIQSRHNFLKGLLGCRALS